jgi:hypothetical protein
MHNRIELLLPQQILDKWGISDVTVDKAQFRPVLHRLEICEITCIGDCVEYDDLLSGVLCQPIVNEI